MQNKRNSHKKQGYINNNNINKGNNTIKDFQDANIIPNTVNNKQKYQKYNNQSTY